MEKEQIAKNIKQEVINDMRKAEQPNRIDMSQIEYISKNAQPYVSPIFIMTEDEILAFVEDFEVEELATLSVQELNRIGEVLGVEPSILVQE